MEWWPAERLEAYQRDELSALLRHATLNVPFYRERGLRPATMEDAMSSLRELPVLTKAEVQRAGRVLIADQYRDRRLEEIHTGGTTGTPLAVYCDSQVLQRNYAFFERFKRSAGVRAGARVATFAGRPLVPPDSNGPFWRHNFASNQLLCSSYHIAPATIGSYVDALARFGPELIDSYPSNLEPLARHIVATGDERLRPRAVITSSETLFPEVRALAERAFGCPVVDHYGGAEMVAFVTQCAHGGYHVNQEYGVLELLVDGRPAEPGETGEIVATGFINPVMPLLRYATGDFATLAKGRCACGRQSLCLERIEGRMDDVIETPEGRLVGRIDPIFKAVSSLHETQVIQDAIDHVRVEVVAGDIAQHELDELAAQLRLRLGPTMRIDIVRVSRIERTARGKLRTVVNLMRRRAPAPAAEAPQAR
jgi:phenylacetate-CoA ligase